MSFEIKGKIKVLFDRQDFPSGFFKRDFVITTNDQYPQDIKFGALKERVEQLDGLSVDDEVTVKFDVKGREYNGNYYVDLNAWRIERGASGQASGQAAQAGSQAGSLGGQSSQTSQASAPNVTSAPLPEVAAVELSSSADSDDDLPF
jgi:single-strand DNA-binding protein|tara:strand:+ start:1675 stop:2115 length:441 start_codon:yes stop_codon:yes gene_type:complete